MGVAAVSAADPAGAAHALRGGTPIFASQLAGFQQTHGLAPTGLLDAATFQVFRGLWQERRPFVMARVGGLCPEPPPITSWAIWSRKRNTPTG